MFRTNKSIEAQIFDRNSAVDLFLLFALANIAVGFGELFSNEQMTLAWPLRLAFTLSVAIALYRLGRNQFAYNPPSLTDVEPLVSDSGSSILDRQTFFSVLDAKLRKNANGFVMLVHTTDVATIDERYGLSVGDFFLSSLVARLEPSQLDQDIVGSLERATIAIFLEDRTLDEVGLVARRMSGSTLVPLGDSADRAQLSAFVGFTEIVPGELLLDPLERANQALNDAQKDGATQVAMWNRRSASD